MPSLELETQLSEIQSIADAMIFMHEACADGDRDRVMRAETALLFIIRDKADVAHKALERLNRRDRRVA